MIIDMWVSAHNEVQAQSLNLGGNADFIIRPKYTYKVCLGRFFACVCFSKLLKAEPCSINYKYACIF